MFSWVFLEPVVVHENTMNATDYLYIIAMFFHHYILSVFGNRNGVLVQDNAPCHIIENVLSWLEEHDTKFHLNFLAKLEGS